MGEERELLMALALNRARVATQRELAIGWWGLNRVKKEWASYWMRARVRCRLKAAREIERQRLAGGVSAADGPLPAGSPDGEWPGGPAGNSVIAALRGSRQGETAVAT